MIRISGIKLNIGEEDKLLDKISKILKVRPDGISDYFIVRKSLDARDKDNIFYNYIVDVEVKDERSVLKRVHNPKVSIPVKKEYVLPKQGDAQMDSRPVVVGSGPAGLFAAYFLALKGYKPIVIERGSDVDIRSADVNAFWEGKAPLNPESNIQFGEGGAGTFSDGKLNTGVNDPSGRNMLVLKTFVENGAPEEILYSNKPHLGTDVLKDIVRNMRSRIIECGGEFRFNTKFSGFTTSNSSLNSINLTNNGIDYELECVNLILATGHSARDTFRMLFESGLDMQGKAFAAGIRIAHPQEQINQIQYGKEYKDKYGDKLAPADYKLQTKTSDGRSVYSFCMCPGGYVVNASSEEGRLCVNGMSYSGRDAEYANSAIIVSVTPEDTGSDTDPMKGIEFQRTLEEKALIGGCGRIPVQRYGDFRNNTASECDRDTHPAVKGFIKYTDLNEFLPDYISTDIKEAMDVFGKKMPGFDSDDTLCLAVESRTSSPVRILRDEGFESNVKGIFPCGEGAGYAGGITSAAIDGIKIFEEIYKRYRPLY